jgi:hypothetical protein
MIVMAVISAGIAASDLVFCSPSAFLPISGIPETRSISKNVRAASIAVPCEAGRMSPAFGTTLGEALKLGLPTIAR